MVRVRKILLACALLVSTAASAADWNAQEYDLYTGDFNGDTRSDMLYVAKDPSRSSGIALSDGTAPNVPWQSWPSNFLGIPWSQGQYGVTVADFNGDGKADIFLQKKTPGDHYLLLTNQTGRVVGISQTVGDAALGIDSWSADTRLVTSADFNGDGKKDLFLQATRPTGMHHVVLANNNPASGPIGMFVSSPARSWNDGYLGFAWSAKYSAVFAGDFDGDGYGDLLVQAKPRMVIIDYDISFPVPVFLSNSNGIVYGEAAVFPSSSASQSWNRVNNGIDWSSLKGKIAVGNFSGDGATDIILQGVRGDVASVLIVGAGRPVNSGLKYAAGTTLSAGVAIAADSARLIAGNFSGSAGLYVQAVSTSGTNYFGSISGGSVSATGHDTSLATTTLPPTAVGRTAGGFEVTALGNSTYTIPISVPPGVGGIQPKISLTYQSNGGNGPLGVGWQIDGLTSIERCRSTIVQDGANGGITLSTTDRFCLAGNRMRLTSASGTYGLAGSTYQTEIETFSRITAYGVAGNGPAYFIVETKDGLKLEYGNTADSRIESTAPGFTTTPRVWAINRVSDRHGNSMTVNYTEDGASGSYRPSTIYHTSNTNAGLASAYSLTFVWETRPSNDVLSMYVAGGLVRDTQRLKEIRTSYNDPVGGWRTVRTFRLGYNTSGTTPRSRLNSVQECDRYGYCLAPTVFTWQNGVADLNAEVTSAVSGQGSEYAVHGDFNGDGRTDILYPVFNGAVSMFWVTYATSTGGFTPAVSTGVAGGNLTVQFTAALPMDFNSDGLADVVLPNNNGTLWQVLRSTGSGFTVVPTTFSAPSTANRAWITDLDGDGRQDLAYQPNSNLADLTILRNTGSAFQSLGTTRPLGTNNFFNALASLGYGGLARSAWQVADVNTDGRQDIVVSYSAFLTNPNRTVKRIGVLTSTGSGYSFDGTALVDVGQGDINLIFDTMRLADFNGDQISDMLYRCVTPFANWCLRFGTGSGFGAEINTGISNGADPIKALVTDWSGDGRSDLLQKNAAGRWDVVTSTGDTSSPLNAPVDTGITASPNPVVGDIDGDGLLDILYREDPSGSAWRYRLHKSPIPDLVTAFTDGFGGSVSAEYSTLTDASIYTKGSGAAYPVVDLQGAMTVVKQYRTTTGIADPASSAGTYLTSESYSGAKVSVNGRGYLGFASRTKTDGRTGAKVTVTYRQDFPFIGLPDNSKTRQANGLLIQETSTLYQEVATSVATYNDRHFPYAGTITENQFEINASNPGFDGLATTRTIVTQVSDSYGSPTSTTKQFYNMTTGAAVLEATTSTNSSPASYPIINDVANWCLGFVQQHETTSTVVGDPSKTRTTRMTRDASALDRCRVSSQVIEPDNSLLRMSTSYTYDAFGHIYTETISGAGIADRVTTISYGSEGVFPRTVTNAENEIITKTYDYALGVVKSATDQNSLTMSWTYNGFGHKERENRPDGTATTWTLYTCNVANGFCGDSVLRYQEIERQLAPGDAVIRYDVRTFDSQARLVYGQSQTLNGAITNVVTRYDSFGRIYQQSTPYFSGGSAYFVTHLYDIAGRPLSESRQVSQTDGATRTLTFSYERLVNKYTDALNRITKKTSNASGQTVSVTDPGGAVTYYAYDPFGSLRRTQDAAGNVNTQTFNVRGFKESSSDVDQGSISFSYYPTGELKDHTDASSQQTTYTYDRMGRMRTRVEAEGTTTFNYGVSQAQKNVGQLESVTSPGGYSETNQFDSLGRPSQTTTVADGTSYVVNSSYDPTTGMLETVTYPTSTSAVPNSRLKTQYVYSYGQLQSVRDANAPGTVYWTANSLDAGTRITSETYGNGITTTTSFDAIDGLIRSRTAGAGNAVLNNTYNWDPIGNLTERSDANLGLSETFYYDSRYRLDDSRLNGVQNLDVNYDAIGNIVFKSDVGAYIYTQQQAACSYAGLTSQAHAVRVAGGVSYCYDRNGNMTRRGNDVYLWTSYNMPLQLTQNAYTSTFSYGAARNRYKQVATSASGTETTIYIGNAFERVTRPGGVIEYKHAIVANDETIAIRTLRNNGVNDLRYLHRDHLGSIIAVTNESGSVVGRLSYNAFGKRRNATTWSGAPAADTWTTASNVTRRGFTGHEHLDNVELVHMNGRVYDPVLGRFLSADPIIQEPMMSQSLNRYSYVMNNPLSALDPTGYSWLSSAFRSIGRFIKKYLPQIVMIIATAMGNPGLGILFNVWYSAVQAIRAGQDIYSWMFGMMLYAGTFATSSLVGKSIIGDDFMSIVMRGAVTGGIGAGARTLQSGGSLWSNFVHGAVKGAGQGALIAAYENSRTPGKLMFPKNGPQDINAYVKDGKIPFYTNGIFTSEQAFQQTLDDRNTPGFYNPTNNVGDIFEAVGQKFFWRQGDPLAEGLANAVAGAKYPISFYAHSQGVLTLTNAVRLYGLSTGDNVFNMRSGALSYFTGWRVIEGSGFGTMTWRTPYFDGANIWAPTMNPIKWVSGFVDPFCGFCFHRANNNGN